ncbi:MAG TPA: hypothetical protein DEF45_19525 [Rhodopirellula sp.]|nr:hypothetical protein [Rhodopirellula sp.]
MRDPKSKLAAGITIRDPALLPHGFVFHFQSAGCCSGGNFARVATLLGANMHVAIAALTYITGGDLASSNTTSPISR